MGQKHERFREFRRPFPLRDVCENPRSNVRACAAGDGAIYSKNRKIVPYHGANPNTRNGARLRSPSLIMAPDLNPIRHWSENWCPGYLEHALCTSEIHLAAAKSLEIIGHVTNCCKRPLATLLLNAIRGETYR